MFKTTDNHNLALERVATLVSMLLRPMPKLDTPPIIARNTSAQISPYSIEVAPWSSRNIRDNLRITDPSGTPRATRRNTRAAEVKEHLG